MLWLHDHAAEVSEELPWDVVQGVTEDPDDYIAGVAYLGQADLNRLEGWRQQGTTGDDRQVGQGQLLVFQGPLQHL